MPTRENTHIVERSFIMIYSHEVEMMCPVAQGANHGPAPIPEEAKWVKAKEVKDISGLTHGIGSVSYTHLNRWKRNSHWRMTSVYLRFHVIRKSLRWKSRLLTKRNCGSCLLYTSNIFLAHLTAFRIFDNSDTTVQFVQVQIFINIHASSCLNMIQNKTFFDFSNT